MRGGSSHFLTRVLLVRDRRARLPLTDTRLSQLIAGAIQRWGRIGTCAGRPNAGTVYGMYVIGHGIDIVEVAYFRRLCAEHLDEALARTFTAAELAHGREVPDRAEHLAGRFAAKEAVLKALGLGWTHEIAWTEIEIGALPSGAPAVSVRGRCAELAAERRITSWLVSISHTSAIAVASVIALGDLVQPGNTSRSRPRAAS